MRFDPPPTSASSGVRPLFCPRCGRFRPDARETTLCPQCGETLAEPGFCPVCERDWPLAVGASCPKHDLALLADRPAVGRDLPFGEASAWVTVRAYNHPIEAEAARLRLDAEGIPTFLEGQRMGSDYSYTVATGGIKLQVPRPLVQEARILLDQSWASPFEEEDDDWDDLPADPEPEAEPEAEPESQSTPLFWVIALAALVAVLAWLVLRLH
jgi:hypothetical protein